MATKSCPEGQKTKPLSSGHPYEKYMDTPLWETIEKAIDDLVDNGDIKETTDRTYIVGYLCKKVSEGR